MARIESNVNFLSRFLKWSFKYPISFADKARITIFSTHSQHHKQESRGYNRALKITVASTLRLRKNQKKIYSTHNKENNINVLTRKHYRLRDSRLAECMDCDCKRFYLHSLHSGRVW